MTKSNFFTTVKASSLFGQNLSQSEVDGCNAILDATQGWKTSWRAYALATTFHETGATMQPVREKGGDEYFSKYGREPLKSRLGNRTMLEGIQLHGRGFVQLTGHDNYVKASAVTGKDLLANPDLAMVPEIAAQILRSGMEKGWFTGKGLGDYLVSDVGLHPQFFNCRHVINSLDCAEKIAGYADIFQKGLLA